MNLKEKIIAKVQKNYSDLNFINGIILELSKEPKVFQFEIVDFLTKTLKKEDLRKININLIYLLGELGKIKPLEEKYVKYLLDSFYISDRWIRQEILKSLEKNIKVVKSHETFIKVISDALKEDYEPNNITALKVVLQLDKVPPPLFRSFLTLINKQQHELQEYITKILSKDFDTGSLIFELLNQNKNYRILKPNGVRLVLQSLISSINEIDAFQTLIKSSDWEDNYKSLFLDEIKIIKNLIKQI